MMNRWGIPAWLENEIRARDKTCIYCGVQMLEKVPPDGSRKNLATWEHIINDARIITRDNIARCCSACNSSKGTKDLAVWMKSNYCKHRNISADSVAEVVKQALKRVNRD
ncbi:HNH endonuclease [bacterium I07]|nr:HNH endonuclease [bacterium I07]